jgi:signal transduction histidine kinase
VQELSRDVPLIQADRQQLRQVFLNLFTNAADAMPLGGLLTIRTWPGEKPEAGRTTPLRVSTTQSLGLPASDSPKVFVEVSDTGEGIPADKLERVWEPFYTTKPEGKGTGLGLAICRRIIHEHGGTIELISDGIPGKGAAILITLPAVKGG